MVFVVDGSPDRSYEFLRENLTGYEQIGARAGLSPSPPARYKNNLIEEVTVSGLTPKSFSTPRGSITVRER